MPSYPLVDVFLLAYNHEPFIGEAVEGVLMQRTSFPVHVTILEDCSTDGTRDIVRRFAEAHPNVINLRLHERNLNNYRSLREALSGSRARYVAVLDGDDSWTSPHKLQRQVDFLEAHPDCALCFHRVEVVDSEGRPITVSPPHPTRFSTIEELFVSNFLYLCSVLYRRSALESIPDWFEDVRAADRNLHLLAARSGRIGYLDEVMAAWRRHPGGVWSPLGPVEQARWAVESQTQLLAHFDEAYHPDIRKGLVNRLLELGTAQAEQGDLEGLAATLGRVRHLAHAAERALQEAARERAALLERAAALEERIEAVEGEHRRLLDRRETGPSRGDADTEGVLSRVARRVKSASPWPVRR